MGAHELPKLLWRPRDPVDKEGERLVAVPGDVGKDGDEGLLGLEEDTGERPHVLVLVFFF